MKKEILKHPIKYAIIVTAGIYLIYMLVMMAIFKSDDESFRVLTCNDILSIESTKESWINIGTFGDMFGALNAFFTALAFFGVLYSLYMQRKSIEQIEANETKNRKLIEKSWYFQQTGCAGQKWEAQRILSKTTKDKNEKCIRKCIKDGYKEDDISFLSATVSNAKGALLAYNVVLYSLRYSENLVDKEELEDIACMTYALLDEDLQFCLGVLFIDSGLVNGTDFLQEIFSEDEFVRKFCKSNMMIGREGRMKELVQEIKKRVRAL